MEYFIWLSFQAFVHLDELLSELGNFLVFYLGLILSIEYSIRRDKSISFGLNVRVSRYFKKTCYINVDNAPSAVGPN